jgi:hypothetical protein
MTGRPRLLEYSKFFHVIKTVGAHRVRGTVVAVHAPGNHTLATIAAEPAVADQLAKEEMQ